MSQFEAEADRICRAFAKAVEEFSRINGVRRGKFSATVDLGKCTPDHVSVEYRPVQVRKD